MQEFFLGLRANLEFVLVKFLPPIAFQNILRDIAEQSRIQLSNSINSRTSVLDSKSAIGLLSTEFCMIITS